MARGTDNSGEFLEGLIAKRRKLIDALDANKGEVNLDIFEDFYPDKAHFVYELLQNAEDAGATEVTFTLESDRLVCEHDGSRRFTKADVSGITGIHNSTKSKDGKSDKIGKFGVGFKSVFVYTHSPTVQSGEFSFRIVKLILPEPTAFDTSLGDRTRFEIPFDNPSKPPKEAHDDIGTGLRDLDETTLLFLSNLQTIKWRIGAGEAGQVLRREHSESHYEVLKQKGAQTTVSSHFLKFDQPVPGLSTHHIAVAFPLDFLAGVREFDASKPLAEQMRIVPAAPGRVAVFFTAAKETSGLLFHLHGPFSPELSRASIKETAANASLFEQLAALCAHSLHRIKDFGLLTPEFLAVLPNQQDQLPERYRLVRDAIIEEMKAHPLTPTHSRSHAAASRLVQAKASLKNLLSEEDIEYLVSYDEEPPLWAVGATQQNSRIDNFLDGLEIQEWGIEEFVGTLRQKADTSGRSISVAPYWATEPDEEFIAWLGQKSPLWLQQFYALLHDDAAQLAFYQLKSLKIVRLSGGEFSVAAQCFFANESTGDRISTVDPHVYSSGKGKQQQEKAKKLLSDLGVRELGEAEEVELILAARYTREAEIPDDKIYLRDLKRFVALAERQPEKAKLFAPYFVFQGETGDWYAPKNIYLDRPFKNTDLSVYYGKLGERADCSALHPRYKDCGVALKRITAFAEAVGAGIELKIARGICKDNPQWAYLRSVGGDRYTSPTDCDYYIPGLRELLETPSLELSRLLWRMLTSLSSDSHPDYFHAEYRRNWSGGTHYADSRLIHELRAAKWVPQADGVFVRPAEATSELLPKGFAFDPGYEGLEAIKFGSEAARQVERARQRDSDAKSLGFADADTLERAKRFAALPPEEQERFFADRERASKSAIPDRDPLNPNRVIQNAAAQAEDAKDRESEQRTRAVSIGRDEVKAEAEQYLRQHYRNADAEMTCQICNGPLPFKLDDGTDFFETVEFLPDLRKRHFQNYLALCPNHSAMYRHANGSKAVIRDTFAGLTGNHLEVLLAQQELTIYLSTRHVLELKGVLEVEDDLLDAEDKSAA